MSHQQSLTAWKLARPAQLRQDGNVRRSQTSAPAAQRFGAFLFPGIFPSKRQLQLALFRYLFARWTLYAIAHRTLRLKRYANNGVGAAPLPALRASGVVVNLLADLECGRGLFH